MVREPKSLYEDTAIPSQYVINKERKQMSRRNENYTIICSKINGVSSNNRSKDFEFFRIIKITEGVSTIENNTIKEIL